MGEPEQVPRTQAPTRPQQGPSPRGPFRAANERRLPPAREDRRRSGAAGPDRHGVGRWLPFRRGRRFTVSDTLKIVGIAAGGAACVGVVGLLVLRLLRGRSLRAALFAIALAGVLAMAARAVGAAHAMFISPADFGTVVVVCVSAEVLALTMAALLGRPDAAGDAGALRLSLQQVWARRPGRRCGGRRLPARPGAAGQARGRHPGSAGGPGRRARNVTCADQPGRQRDQAPPG